MKQDSSLRNNLKSIRTRLAMSQQDLANIAGVTRQTISGVESGQYAPSVEITLRLAKALGCQVEHLFWLERDLPEIEAIIAKPVGDVQQLRVSLARVGGQWIAYPLIGKDAFRQDMIPADGEAHRQSNTDKLRVRLLDDNMDSLYNTVVITGCSPVISLWARATERWHPQLRVQYNLWLHCTVYVEVKPTLPECTYMTQKRESIILHLCERLWLEEKPFSLL